MGRLSKLPDGLRRVLPIALVLALPATAAAASASLRVIPHTVRAGKIVHISGNVGSGCPHHGKVTVISAAFHRGQEFAGVNALLLRIRSSGSFAAETRIPSSRAAGRYRVSARCGGGRFGNATIRVTH